MIRQTELRAVDWKGASTQGRRATCPETPFESATVHQSSAVRRTGEGERQMKDAVLLELARRWDNDAQQPQCENGADDAQIANAIAKGERQAKRACADALRALVGMLGNDHEQS